MVKIRLAFTAPVLIQLVSVVGLVGWLSFRTGRQAVRDLASQLRSEVSGHIEGELESYLSTPHKINRINAAAFAKGNLDIENAAYGEHLLFQQMQIHPSIALVYCGSVQNGEFFGIRRESGTGELQLSYSNTSNDFYQHNYSLDVWGSRQHFAGQPNSTEPFDSRMRPWFQAAIQADSPTWTEVYYAFTSHLPNITASLPVYDRGGNHLLGVCGTDVVLPEEFRAFLQNLRIGQSGEAFVIDRKGNLISSSSEEALMKGLENERQLLQAIDSNNPLIQESAAYLLAHFGSFNQILQNQQQTFEFKGKRQFLEVLPFNDGFGLDWLIVVVTPESDFMGRILANTRDTAILCAIALLIALGVGIVLARRVTAPILQLNTAVKDIARGQWSQRVEVKYTNEVGELADSVNTMAAQIQQAFDLMEAQRNAFSRFFLPEYLQFLDKESVIEVELGDHVSADMAVMFSDIRGFTSLVEKMEPQETFDFINTYVQRISPEVRVHEGFVVKFLGDGVMAVFPRRVEDAIDSALAQLQRIHEFNHERERDNLFTIKVGIGLHAGHVMAGIIGEHHRFQPDAVSDTVNLAARLEGLSKVYGAVMIISEAVRVRLEDPDRYQLRFLDRVIVKGRTEPIAIYEVLDAELEMERVHKTETLAVFNAGMKAYSDRDLTAAQAHFASVLEQNPGDKTAQLYEQRISLLIGQGLPQDWDGA
nr:adenylate/guanylate cyclase domain-containing protein [Leptolyngbyaceae cyanobacterium MO_188.B28]